MKIRRKEVKNREFQLVGALITRENGGNNILDPSQIKSPL